MRDWYRGCALAFQARENGFESLVTLQPQRTNKSLKTMCEEHKEMGCPKVEGWEND